MDKYIQYIYTQGYFSFTIQILKLRTSKISEKKQNVSNETRCKVIDLARSLRMM